MSHQTHHSDSKDATKSNPVAQRVENRSTVTSESMGPDRSGHHAELVALQRAIGNRAMAEQLDVNRDTNNPESVPDRFRSVRSSRSSPDEGTPPPIVREVLRSSGRPLASDTRAKMEARFDRDFNHVRLHTDSKAVESARALGASAYTAGADVVLAADRYSPGTARANDVLAHELAHVVQSDSRSAASPVIESGHNRWEQEARRAESASPNDSISLTTGAPPAIRTRRVEFKPRVVTARPYSELRRQIDRNVSEIIQLARASGQRFETQMEDIITDFVRYAKQRIESKSPKITAKIFVAKLIDVLGAALGGIIKTPSGKAGISIVKFLTQGLATEVLDRVSDNRLVTAMDKFADVIDTRVSKVNNHIERQITSQRIKNIIDKNQLLYANNREAQTQILRDFTGVPDPDVNYYTPMLNAMVTRFRELEWESEGEFWQGLMRYMTTKQQWAEKGAQAYTEQQGKERGYE